MNYVFSTTDTVVHRFPTAASRPARARPARSRPVAEVFITVLEPGERAPLHSIPTPADFLHSPRSRWRSTIGAEQPNIPVEPGDVVRIPPDTWHMIANDGSVPVRYVSVDAFPGARPTDEPTWDDHVHGICADKGWDFTSVNAQSEAV